MAKKFDKEMLIKHRFWIGLGVFGLFLLVLLILLPTIMGSMASKARADWKTANTAVANLNKAPNDFANPKWVDPLQSQEKVVKKRKGEVWKDAWLTQDGLMTWPGDRTAPLNEALANAYFLDPITEPAWRRQYADTLYADQWGEFKNAIVPAYYQGGSAEAVLHPITSWEHAPPTSEELWLAQEDLWVKRELVDIVRNTIDATARFERVDVDAKKEPPPEGTLAVHRFRNPNWEVTLFLKKEKDGLVVSSDSTIKNISADHRRLPLAGVMLRVEQSKGGVSRGAVDLVAEGEPLQWGDKPVLINRKPTRVPDFDAADPVDVWQVLTWNTSPVKRLDRVEIGTKEALSHRFAKYVLQAKAAPGAKEESKDAQPSSTSPMPGSMGPGSGPPETTGSYGMNSPRPGGKQGGADKSGPEKNRYIDLSDQVRRLPVAMVLVVDQAHIQDVLASVSNSRLRIWTTQYLWQHVRGVQPPSGGQSQLRTEAPGRPGMGPGSYGMNSPRPGSFGPGMGPGATPGGKPPPGFGSGPGGPMGPGSGPPGTPSPPGIGDTGNRPSGSVSDEDDPNLVELVVYGIASLYERYPPKPQTSPAPGSTAPPAGGTPPGPAAAPAAPGGTPPAPGTAPAPGGTPPAPAAPAGTPPAPAGTTTPPDKTPSAPPADKTPSAPPGGTPPVPGGTATPSDKPSSAPPSGPTTPPAPPAPGSKP